MICVACGAPWKLMPPELHEPSTAPLCTCGVALVDDHPPGAEGSARILCKHCYRAKRAATAAGPS